METVLPTNDTLNNPEIPYWLDPIRREAMKARQRHLNLRELLNDWATSTEADHTEDESRKEDTSDE